MTGAAGFIVSGGVPRRAANEPPRLNGLIAGEETPSSLPKSLPELRWCGFPGLERPSCEMAEFGDILQGRAEIEVAGELVRQRVLHVGGVLHGDGVSACLSVSIATGTDR